jgi:exodeoxyribonuclease VII small subunit
MSEKESFEAALKKLEEAVARLECGDLSLEEALECFEQGVKCAARCRESLKVVETRVELLLKGRNGELKVENFGGE